MSIADIASKAIVVAENAPKVYEAGRKFEHDRFWDKLQDYGNRTNYGFDGYSEATKSDSGHFLKQFWGMSNFYPKYDINVVGSGNRMMYAWDDVGDGDLAQRLINCGVKLDTSKMTDGEYMFSHTYFTRLPFVDLSSATIALHGVFEYSEQLHTIDGVRFSESTAIHRHFVRCGKLVNCPFEGVIAQNGLNVSWSTKLSHDSLMSIINCLKDYSTDTSGTSWAVTLGTDNLAKLTDAEKAIATQKGWTLA